MDRRRRGLRTIVELWLGSATANSTVMQECNLTEAHSAIRSLAFSADGKWLATGSADAWVRLYAMKGENSPELKHSLEDATNTVSLVAVSSDGLWIAAYATDNHVRLYSMSDASGPKLARDFSASGSWVCAMAFSSDSRWLTTGSTDGVVSLRNLHHGNVPMLALGQRAHAVVDATKIISGLAFSADGRWLTTGSIDNSLRFYVMQYDGAPLLAHVAKETVCTVGGQGLAFTRSSRWLAAGFTDSYVRIYATESDVPELVHTMMVGSSGTNKPSPQITALAFSGDDTWLAVGDEEKHLRIYSVLKDAMPELRYTFRDEPGAVFAVAFSVDGHWLATGSSDKRVRLYNMESDGTPIIRNATSVCWRIPVLSERGYGAVNVMAAVLFAISSMIPVFMLEKAVGVRLLQCMHTHTNSWGRDFANAALYHSISAEI